MSRGRPRWLRWVGLLLIAEGSWTPALFATARALLVGVGTYPHSDSVPPLLGPANDVELFREILIAEPFGIAAAEVAVLAGWPDDRARRPTRGNIERAFRELAQRSESGDDVFVLLAGHGSRQPADIDSSDPEPDGLDEIFLTADFRAWSPAARGGDGVIVDDELEEWVSAILDRGASVWILVDACHSGTMTRAAGERIRGVSPSELGVPAAALREAARRPVAGARAIDTRSDGANRGRLVAMYAAQPFEETPERILPDRYGDYHGLFSYTVASVLRTSGSAISFRELAAEVGARYRARGQARPTPMIEGDDLDRELLGARRWPGRGHLRLGRSTAGRWTVDAGDLTGLSVGSILSIHPPFGAASQDSILGYVRVDAVSPLTSTVEAVERRGAEWRPTSDSTFPADARCSLVTLGWSDRKVRVAIGRSSGADQASSQRFAALEDALGAVSADRAWIKVESEEEAEWILRATNDQAILVAATPEPSGATLSISVGSLTDAALGARLDDTVSRIARARQLLSLNTRGLPTNERGPRVDLEVFRFRDARDPSGEPVHWSSRGRILEAGDEVAFEVVNRSGGPVDVTLLFIDGRFGIHPLDFRRLASGERAFPINRSRVVADTVGHESVVAIAVRAEGAPRSFAALAQPTLKAYRESSTTRQAGSQTPLSEFLESALYSREVAHRGAPRPAPIDYAISVLPWITEADSVAVEAPR